MEYDQNQSADTETSAIHTNGGDSSKPEQYRVKAADALHEGAEKAREWGSESPGGNRTTRWGENAGEGLDNASEYLRDHSLDEITHDVTDWTRRHPTPALLCALTLGFLAGRAIRS